MLLATCFVNMISIVVFNDVYLWFKMYPTFSYKWSALCFWRFNVANLLYSN